ncbi:MAG: hypothetical protein SH807_03005 [Blastochloris sp.]|nr:hypothetical protein [Blastochloris sp.]
MNPRTTQSGIFSTPTPVVIWLRVGNCRNSFLLAQFLRLLPDIIEHVEMGDHLIEVR